MRQQAIRSPVTDALRSRIMRSNKSKGNLSTELTLARLLRAARISGWRRGIVLVGRPDFVFKRQQVALFVDGCYWHGCKCKRPPKANRRYWIAKFCSNRARDRKINRQLQALGWTVVRVKEHQLKKNPQLVIRRISELITELSDIEYALLKESHATQAKRRNS